MEIDVRTVIEIIVTVGSAVAVIARLEVNMRWMERSLARHEKSDAVAFKSIDTQLEGIRNRQG
jgi:hypothetical protein